MDQRTWEQISTSRAPMRERAGTYFLGIAIGCGMLGLLWMARTQAVRGQPRANQALSAPIDGKGTPANSPAAAAPAHAR